MHDDLAIYKFNATGDVKDPVLYKTYKSCLANYTSAGEIVRGLHMLTSETGNYKNLPSKISDAIKEAETCDKAFVQPTKMDPSIKEITSLFQDLSSIVLQLSNILA